MKQLDGFVADDVSEGNEPMEIALGSDAPIDSGDQSVTANKICNS